jgi:hypothetical protein
VYLAGLQIPDEDVRALAKLVDERTRSLLQKSLGLTGRTPGATRCVADRAGVALEELA